MFKSFASNIDYPEMEHRILEFWERNDIFAKLVARNRGHERYSFFDGPITANNPQGMGVHHAWGRTYKDIYQRHRAMLGFDQRYQNGFDCQGLWVEVEVEKELGLNSKRDILDYGLDRFCTTCRERVEVCAGAIVEKSKRLGQWMDWDHSYFTMSDANIEHIWHFLKRCHTNGWLYRGHRCMPWCTRCGTSLSQHELIDAYKDLVHRSVFMKLPIHGREREHLLVWTTTPWTLTANTACAVHPDLTYVRIEQDGDILYLSEGTMACLKPGYEQTGTVKGADLVGLVYTGPFEDLEAQHSVQRRVVAWDHVGEDEGTGIVHIAPGCGAEDFELSQTEDLAVITPIDENGYYGAGFNEFTGRYVQEVAPLVFQSLEGKGLLYKLEDYAHRYPNCWRCGEELVFRLVDEWFIRCDEIRPRMIREARKVRWIPEHAGKRMEDWLNNMGDWCISRKRFWGLPLPFYICGSCSELTVVGSVSELKERSGSDLSDVPELHRPWIDSVTIPCPHCGGRAERIPEVGDCWLDAGIIPFSTLGYLSSDRSQWDTWFPADFISEMREQIRLWFYSMLFMSVTLEDRTPYQAVLTYEKMHDEHGQPMHKSSGNAIWFDDAAERMGADVMRWLYARHNVMNNINFGFGPAEEVKREMLTLWNVLSFFSLYANIDQPQVSLQPDPSLPRADIDRWLMARTQETVRAVGYALENYNSRGATESIEKFLDDLSNWYVRRNRRRFWKSADDQDKLAAYQTLFEALVTLAKLLAPILPFTAEEMYQGLVLPMAPEAPESVHLCPYPQSEAQLIDEELLAATSAVMHVVTMGRALRAARQLKVRQPLARILVKAPSPAAAAALQRLEEQVLDELNVKALECIDNTSALTSSTVKPNFALLGPKYGKLMPKVKATLEAADSAALAARVAAGETIRLSVDGQELELLPAELVVEEQQREGLTVLEEGGWVVALDTQLTDDLIEEGWARDVVRNVQDLRKRAGLEVTDHIDLHYRCDNPLAAAVSSYADYIGQETLADRLINDELAAGAATDEFLVGGHSIQVAVRRTESQGA